MADQMTVEQWLATRKKAGLHIDPEAAEVEWTYAQTLDPYSVDPDLPEEYRQVGREYFARSPASDVWVWFGDLPEATRNALWEKHKRKLAFPGRSVVLTEARTPLTSAVGSRGQGVQVSRPIGDRHDIQRAPHAEGALAG
jgi:hypothetical protein